MADSRSATPARRPDIHAVKPVDVFRPSWWVGGAILLVLLFLFVRLLVTNENLQWSVVWKYLFSGEIMAGLGRTLMLTFLSMIVGLIIGTVIAIMRLSGNPIFRATSWVWIWFFRGVPPLVQLVFWYNLGLLIPEVSIGIPFGATLWSAPTNQLITPLSAALFGLAFTESAYAAEMIRAGIQAVNIGQTEAAATLGMTQAQTLRRIVLPQALRIIIPPIGNDTISMLKFTSLVSVLALPDLLYSAQMIYSRTYQTIPLLIVATIWYLVLSTVLTFIEHYIERRLKDEASMDYRAILKGLFKSKFWGLRRGEVLP